MSKIDDSSRLQHIRDAAREAIEFLAGTTKSDLASNRVLTLALVKEIEIIGEAATNLSVDLKTKHPQLPWTEIIGMRNRLVHAYFEIDLEIVWEVVNNDLPPLLKEIEQMIELYREKL